MRRKFLRLLLALIVFLIAWPLINFSAGILVAPQGVQQWLEEFSWWPMVGADVRAFVTTNWAISVAALLASLAYRYVLKEPSQYLEERLFPPETTKAYKDLHSPDYAKRKRAVENLANQKDYGGLKRALKIRYPDVQTEAALKLAESNKYYPIRQLIEIVKRTHSYVTEEHCESAIVALGKCRAHNAGAVLAETLNDSSRNEQVRKAAACAMGKIKSTKATKNALTQALKDDKIEVAISAAKALGQLEDITAIDDLNKELVEYSNKLDESKNFFVDNNKLLAFRRVANAAAEALVSIIKGQKQPSRWHPLTDKGLQRSSNDRAKALWFLVEALHSTREDRYGHLLRKVSDSDSAREMALRELSLALGDERKRKMAIEALVFLVTSPTTIEIDPFTDQESATKIACNVAKPILQEALNDRTVKNDVIKALTFIDTVN